MPPTLDSRASLLLELMREADDEAVTLDELAVAGIEDAATALLALERAGFGVERVIDRSERGQTLACVRLARPIWPIDAPAPAPPLARGAPSCRRPATETQLTPPRVALLALVTLGLAWLLRAALRGR
jgi:hypothetical protein